MKVPEIDQRLGIEVYATGTRGIGGVIRESIEDFRVEEVLVDGSQAKIEETPARRVLNASSSKQRYLLCVLVKRNWDTFIAVKNVARELGIDQKRIQIAGIKDAKAVTAQHITIEQVTREEAEKVWVKDVELRPLGYFHEALSSFYLLGNSFAVKIKNLTLQTATTEKRAAKTILELEALGGIPNFYGHQRFGTTRAITHVVGKAMVKGDFREAAMLFLAKPSPFEHPESRQARRELQAKQDFKQALKCFPKQLRFERLMLASLVEKPEDFTGAFRTLPLKLRMLFVQAYQSFLFNRFLSARIKSGFALNSALTGDYIVNMERSGLPMTKTRQVATSENLAEINKLIRDGRMRVALPMVGVTQKYPQGAMSELEKRILEEEAVEAEDFRVDAMPEVSGRGGLRAVTAPIRNFKLDAASTKAGKREAELEFMLLRGSYATVLLREVMKPQNPITAGF